MILIIPDIHGRTFWKEAVKKHNFDEIIFLGDYVDPYYWEGIEPLNVLANFKEIVDFKKANMDKVTLLLGNHDFGGYISGYTKMEKCRHDFENQDAFKEIFDNNLNLFKIVVTREINNKKFTFSHAAILKNWILACKDKLGEYSSYEELFNNFNNMLINDPKTMTYILSYIGRIRGGYSPYGSIIWADYREYNIYDNIPELDGYYEIFGHTQLESNPVITNLFADLDCRRAFILNNEGIITELDGSIPKQEKDIYY